MINFDNEEKIKLLENELNRRIVYVDKEKYFMEVFNNFDDSIISIPNKLSIYFDKYHSFYVNKLRDDYKNEFKNIFCHHLIYNGLDHDYMLCNTNDVDNKYVKFLSDHNNDDELKFNYLYHVDKKYRFDIYLRYLNKLIDFFELIYDKEENEKKINFYDEQIKKLL